MRTRVVTSDLWSLSDGFDRAGCDTQHEIEVFAASLTDVSSVDILGSSAMVETEREVRDQWLSQLTQLVSSLACLTRKMRLTADYYEQADDAANPAT